VLGLEKRGVWEKGEVVWHYKHLLADPMSLGLVEQQGPKHSTLFVLLLLLLFHYYYARALYKKNHNDLLLRLEGGVEEDRADGV
jgi:hypothetical protein